MGRGFGLLAGIAAAALLVPFKVDVNKETGEWESRSLLLKIKVKSGAAEGGDAKKDYSVEFADAPTKEDFETIKKNVSDVAGKGVKFAKETVEKVKEKFKSQTGEETSGEDDMFSDFGEDEESV